MNGEVKVFCCCCFFFFGGVGSGWGGRGVRVDVNGEMKFWWKFKKNEGSGLRGRVGMGGGRGVRVDVNSEVKFL